MARVPTPDAPLQPKPIDPGYQRVETPASAFGALQAESLARSGERLQQLSGGLAERAIQNQEKTNAVARARDLGAFGQSAQDDLNEMTTGQDITDPATVAGYGQRLSKNIDDIVANHAGGPESAMQLRARLELQRTQFLSHATGLADTAREKLVDDTVKTGLLPITAEAYRNPGDLESLLKRSDGNIADFVGGLGAQKATALTNQARQEVLKSAIQGVLDRGDVEGASKLTNEYAALLSPETQRYFQSHITIAQVAADKAKNATNALVAQATQILGRAPNAQERLVLAGLARPDDPNKAPTQYAPTPTETIAAFEKATGKPATDEQKAVAFGLAKAGTQGGAFGNSLRGRSLSIVDEDAVAFASGLLTPDREQRFVTAVNELQRPYQKANPETGILEQVTQPLPPVVIEAFQRRGMPLPTATGATVLPGQGGQPQPAPAPAPAPSPAPAPGAAQPASAGGAPAAAAEPAPGGSTIWELNRKGLVTGPVPAAAELANRTPGIGGMLPGAESTQARTFVELQARQLVKALQTNKNFAVKEMQSIEKDLDITPSLHDNSDAYAARLIAVDESLAKLEQQALKQSDNGSGLPLETRKEARVSANLIHEFRNTLGVPPKLTPEQARKLPVGAAFRTDKGDVRYVTKAVPQQSAEGK